MKKLILTLAIAVSGYCTNAQNTFPSTGNVGIGTISPTVPLDIAQTQLHLADPSTSPWANYSYVKTTGTTFNTQTFTLGTTYGYNTPVDALSIYNGNVGVGTTTPGSILHLSNGGPSIILDANSQGTDLKRTYLATSEVAAGDFVIGTRYDNNTVKSRNLYITNSGNVGIGTASPNAKLDVNGTPAGVGYHHQTAVTFGTVNGGLGAVSDGLTIQRIGSGGVITPALKLANYWSANAAQDVVAVDFTTGDGNGVGTTVGRIAVATADVDPYMAFSVNGSEYTRILHNGNMGIGTTTPDAKLAVNGTIHAKEVKVDLTGWPDYVFKPKYKLPSLSEVKTYISKKQHLPGLPSEDEVAKNGVNLGEIVKVQTKKIEELTLYAIEQQKRIDQLEKEKVKNKKQEKRISKLEAALLKLTSKVVR